MTLATVARRHLLARPFRTLLTIGAIGLSVGLTGFLIVLADALQLDWSPMMGQRAIVMARTSFFEKLPLAYLPKIVETTVRAVMGYKLDNGVYLHRRYFEQLTGDEGLVQMFWVMAKSRDDVAPVTAEIERRFENAPYPIRAMTEKQWQLMFMQMLGNVKVLIGTIGLATAFAPALHLSRHPIVQLLREAA